MEKFASDFQKVTIIEHIKFLKLSLLLDKLHRLNVRIKMKEKNATLG